MYLKKINEFLMIHHLANTDKKLILSTHPELVHEERC